MNRPQMQTIVTKLDLGHIKLVDAKRVARQFGFSAAGRGKEAFIQGMNAELAAQQRSNPCQPTA